MKSIVERINAVNLTAYFSFPMLFPVAFNTRRGASSTVSTSRELDGKVARAGELLGGMWNAIISPGKRPCIECLVDIAGDAERCPNCQSLQNSEADLLSRGDIEWH